jgi:membrane fusion protein (multidrug efflux system)
MKALDRADTNLRIRRAERDIAAEQLARRNLFAPFEGLVVDRQPELGEIVNPGARVATLMSLDPLRLEVGVPGYQVGLVQPGAAVSITLPALNGEAFQAVVKRVAPAAIEAGHLFEVEILVANPDLRLRPGMSARAQIVTQTLDDVLSVPLDLVVERNSRRVIFFISDHRARAVDVSDAPIHRDRILIPSGIGWRTLVMKGQRDLRDYGPVRVDNTVLAGDPGA